MVPVADEVRQGLRADLGAYVQFTEAELLSQLERTTQEIRVLEARSKLTSHAQEA
jgi:hypothetical protein